jgi:hypothetical protein
VCVCVCVCACVCVCVCLYVRPAHKVTDFQTAQNQTVFIAGIPYLAHPSTHICTPLLTLVQGQGHFWRVLDFGLSLRLTFGFHSYLHYYFIDFFQLWFISLVSMTHPSAHNLTPLLTLG